jgi:recombination protein RecR
MPELPSDPINSLIKELSSLPGIGPKSAQRITYYLLRTNETQVTALADALITLKKKTKLCRICCNVSENDICSICSNPNRNPTLVLIVEQPQDIVAIEHTGAYHGRYHVLHGSISPTEGVGENDLRIQELLARLQDGAVKEVVIGTNPTREGETTALYLKKLISPLGIKVTRLARGLPFGSELEYADDTTISNAFEGRQDF